MAAGKAHTGRALGNPVLQTEGRVTLIDGDRRQPLLDRAADITPVKFPARD